MTKQVKKNKSLKWINSRYSTFYKARLSFRAMQLAQLCINHARTINTIKSSTSTGCVTKSVAIASAMLEFKVNLSNMPKVKGRLTKING